MKDKQAKKLTMNDVINEYRNETDSPLQNQVAKQQEEIEVSVTPDEYYEKLKQHNLRLSTNEFTTDDYRNVKPLHNVIVRVMVREPEVTASGLLKPYKQIVAIPTQNGISDWAEVESPYPYDVVAKVIAKPDSITQVNVGDTVILSKNPVEAKVVGKAQGAFVIVPNAFTLPSWREDTPPKDPSSEHYGYLIIPVYEIKAIL